jgi:hypothetical protein
MAVLTAGNEFKKLEALLLIPLVISELLAGASLSICKHTSVVDTVSNKLYKLITVGNNQHSSFFNMLD